MDLPDSPSGTHHPAWLCSDRRDSQRVELRHRDACVRTRGQQDFSVVDVSASGLGVVVSTTAAASLMDGPLTVCLGVDTLVRGHGRLVRQCEVADGVVRAGLALDLGPVAVEELRRFLLQELDDQQDGFDRYLNAPDAVASSDPGHVRRVLRLHADARAPAIVVFEGEHRVGATLRIERVGEGTLGARQVSGDPLRPGRRYGLLAQGRCAASAFTLGLRAVEGPRLTFAFPTQVTQSGFRRSARYPVTTRSPLLVSFENPRTGHTVQESALDASIAGLSLRLDPEVGSLFPGEAVRNLRITLPSGIILAQGIARSVQPAENATAGEQCGIELVEFGSHGDQKAWTDFVYRELHPRLIHHRKDAQEGGWDVLESSGYVDLWTSPEDRPHLYAQYRQFWSESGPEHGSVFTVADSSRPVATITSSALWPRTFMVHHLGVDQDVRADRGAFLSYTRELYSALTYELQEQQGLDYVSMFMEADKGWNEFLYGGFARVYDRPRDLLWLRNQVFRAHTTAPVPASPMDRFVHLAMQPEFLHMAEVYRRTRHPLECEALELCPEGLSRDGFARRFGTAGHGRTRESFVFAPAGQPLWGMVCETGSEGANVFGLLNQCWLTQLSPCGSQESSVARQALLRRALAHYAEAGKHSCLLLEPAEGSSADALTNGFERVSEGSVWISRRDVMPAWLAYIDDALTLSRSRQRQAA